jgi:hypothetical protein
MKKFNYQISFFANSAEEAWEKIHSFEKQTPHYFRARILKPDEVIDSEMDNAMSDIVNQLIEEFQRKKSSPKEEEAKNILSGIQMVENAIQIIGRCMEDPSVIGKIAQTLKINVSSKSSAQ